MSYVGTNSVGPFLQGLSTSAINDTWAANIVDYTAANSVSTLQNGLSADWRICPHIESTGPNGRSESRRPTASTTEFALMGAIGNYTTSMLCEGDECVLSVDADTVGYFLYSSSGSGSIIFNNYERWTTICELLT
jgi:hypothetical protein